MVAAPTDKLGDTPTLGAIRRRDGITDWCPEARVAFAVELVHEAIRRAVIDALDPLLTASVNSPEAIAQRLRRIADDIDPPKLATAIEEAA
jgi:hypothetical protein